MAYHLNFIKNLFALSMSMSMSMSASQVINRYKLRSLVCKIGPMFITF